MNGSFMKARVHSAYAFFLHEHFSFICFINFGWRAYTHTHAHTFQIYYFIYLKRTLETSSLVLPCDFYLKNTQIKEERVRFYKKKTRIWEQFSYYMKRKFSINIYCNGTVDSRARALWFIWMNAQISLNNII